MVKNALNKLGIIKSIENKELEKEDLDKAVEEIEVVQAKELIIEEKAIEVELYNKEQEES